MLRVARRVGRAGSASRPWEGFGETSSQDISNLIVGLSPRSARSRRGIHQFSLAKLKFQDFIASLARSKGNSVGSAGGWSAMALSSG